MYSFRCVFFCVLSACCAFFSPAGMCDDANSCSDCTAPAFPKAQELLENHGYLADEYTVLLTWREAARDGSGTTVAGMRVAPPGDMEPFDLYCDAEGNLLTKLQLEEYGIGASDGLLSSLVAAYFLWQRFKHLFQGKSDD